MAISDLRKFYFYQLYTWDPEDFENFETYLWGAVEGLLEGGFGASILKGLRPRAGGGLNLLVDSGIAVNESGKLVVQTAQQSIAVPAPVGNPCRSLVILRPKTTDATMIPLPTNPSLSVPLHEKLEYDLLILSGTASPTPVYPTALAGDIVVVGLKLSAGHTTLTESDFDWSVVSRPRKRKQKIKEVTSGSYTPSTGDDMIELNLASASGMVQLPPAADFECEKITVVRVDASANFGTVSGYGAELISGQNSIELDTQWQTLTLYSNGLSWRSI